MAKFTEEFDVNGYEVLTDSGWVDIKSIGKTIPYRPVTIWTDSSELTCADEHILFDEAFNEVYAKDLKLGQKIQTKDGPKTIIALNKLEDNEEIQMYDLCLAEDSDHRYYTNGFLSHNSTVYTIFATHYCLFNKDKRVLMVANKEATVKELLQRIKMAWTLIPDFLKIGVNTWSAKKIEFENGSSIMISATSPDAARGSSCDVCLDENTWICIRKGNKTYQVPICSLVTKVPTVKTLESKFTFKDLIKSSTEEDATEDYKFLTDLALLKNCKHRHQLQYHIDNGTFSIPVCPICGKKLYNRFRNGHYYSTCSVACSKKLAKISKVNKADDKLKILTTRGFEDFYGVSVTETDEVCEFLLSGNIRVSCSLSHKFLTPLGLKSAKDLKPGDVISGLITDKIVLSKKTVKKPTRLYDIINSGSDNLFIINGDIISHNCILDEAAFIDNGKMQEFVESVFPTISSKPEGKIIAVSTPNGVGNWFERTYHNAVFGNDEDFKWAHVTFPWWEHPYRDETWKKKQLASLNYDERSFAQEFECKFLGSSATLFDPKVIEHYTKEVISTETGHEWLEVFGHKVKQFEKPTEDHAYVLGADVSDGSGNDRSVIQVFDVTDCKNIVQVASFSSREVGVSAFAMIVAYVGATYNYALICGERNGVGAGFFDLLYETYEYDNILNLKSKDEMADRPGIYSTNNNKVEACLWAKLLLSLSVEMPDQFRVIIKEKMTCGEMEYFESKTKNRVVSYQASKNNHDDFVMSFIWAMLALKLEHAENYFNIRETKFLNYGTEVPAKVQPIQGLNYPIEKLRSKVVSPTTVSETEQKNRELLSNAVFDAVYNLKNEETW